MIQRKHRVLMVVVLLYRVAIFGSAHAQAKSKYACDEPDPASLCTAANTCGSGSACTIDITKAGQSSNVKPSVPNAKNNQFFCIKKGTPSCG